MFFRYVKVLFVCVIRIFTWNYCTRFGLNVLIWLGIWLNYFPLKWPNKAIFLVSHLLRSLYLNTSSNKTNSNNQICSSAPTVASNINTFHDHHRTQAQTTPYATQVLYVDKHRWIGLSQTGSCNFITSFYFGISWLRYMKFWLQLFLASLSKY